MTASIPTQQASTHRKTMRFRFTLRFLAGVVLIVGVVGAWFALKTKRNRERIAAVQSLTDRGAVIFFTQSNPSDAKVPLRDPLESDPFCFDPTELEDDPFDSEQEPFETSANANNESDSEPAKVVSETLQDDAWVADVIATVEGGDSWEVLGGPQALKPYPVNLTVCYSGSGDRTLFAALCQFLGEPSPIEVHRIDISGTYEHTWTDNEYALLSHLRDAAFMTIHAECDFGKLPTMPEVRSLVLAAPTSKGVHRLPKQNWLDKFPVLESLTLVGFDLRGDERLSELRRLPHLEWLDLNENRINDEGMQRIMQLPGLRNLWIDPSNLSPDVLEAFSNACPECRLNQGLVL